MNFADSVVVTLKIIGTIFCVIMFILLMADVWTKFTNKMTHTGARNIYNDQVSISPTFYVQLLRS